VNLDRDEALRRSERLLRWYPKEWRSRYGEEFAELLIADICEQPRSWRRNADVAQSGLVARLTGIGLSGHALEPSDQARTSLATLGCAMAVFLVFGVAMWAQLTIGWQWSEPDATATSAGMIAMSAAVLVFFALAVVAVVPIGWTALARLARHRGAGLVRPSLLFLGGLTILIVGGRHFGNGWPGTGGHPWAHQGLVPGGVAAFTWASTLSVSSYWAHPGSLLSFPAAEVAWMAISPLAMICLVVGAAKTIRRLDLSARILHFEAALGVLAAFDMLAFLAGCSSWIIYGDAGPQNLFHVGAIDVAGLVLMVLALAVAYRAVHRARVGLNLLAR